MIPVRDTPNNLSSSVLVFHILRKYLKSVSVDCNVPSIVANFTFSLSVLSVSVLRATTSDRLQN